MGTSGQKKKPEAAMDGMAKNVPPLVTWSFIQSLREETSHGSGYRGVFVRKFFASLPQYLRRLRLALTTGHLEGALETTAALKALAHHAAAEQMEDLVSDLEHKLTSQPCQTNPSTLLPSLATHFLPLLDRCAHRTIQTLNTP